MRRLLAAALLLGMWAAPCLAIPGSGMARVPTGRFVPFYTPRKGRATVPVQVPTFHLQECAVTNRQFLAFVRSHPQWLRSKVPRIFAEERYLQGWKGDLEVEESQLDSPVTCVSWFAARAYARACGLRLPTQNEWEFAARASETAVDGQGEKRFQQRILDWYAHPSSTRLPHVRSTYRNVYGIHDMHGLVWEWVDDFNSLLLTGESRQDPTVDRGLFCAAGALSSTNPKDYAAYMRYAFRYSLQARYALPNLGFRCASSTPR